MAEGTHLVSLDVSTEENTQCIGSIKHNLTVSSRRSNVYDGEGSIDILQLAANILLLELLRRDIGVVCYASHGFFTLRADTVSQVRSKVCEGMSVYYYRSVFDILGLMSACLLSTTSQDLTKCRVCVGEAEKVLSNGGANIGWTRYLFSPPIKRSLASALMDDSAEMSPHVGYL